MISLRALRDEGTRNTIVLFHVDLVLSRPEGRYPASEKRSAMFKDNVIDPLFM